MPFSLSSGGGPLRVPPRPWGGPSTGLSCPPWPPPPSPGLHQAVLRRHSLPLEGGNSLQPAGPLCEQQGLPETRRRSLQWGARKLSAIPGTPSPRSQGDLCPLPCLGSAQDRPGPGCVCPERDLCAEGASLLAPTLRRAVGVTTAQAVSRPGAACTVSWSAGPGRAGREGRLVGRAPPQPSSTPTLPCGLAGGKWGLPSRIREGDTGQVTLTPVSWHWTPPEQGALLLTKASQG